MNPALLKLELMAHGVEAAPGLPEPLTNPFGLVHLVLPEEVAASVHLCRRPGETPFLLSAQGKSFSLTERTTGKVVPVSWTPPLKSYEKRSSTGVSVADILTVHGGFIAVHPPNPCRFGQSGLSCRYCGSSRELGYHPPFSKKDLVEAIKIVLREKRADFVHLSSGRVDTEDGGVTWLAPWVNEVRKQINVLISLDLVPPATNDWIDKTYAMGVDALYYDLDFFSPKEEARNQFEESRKRQLEALTYAAKIFPRGAVLSHLVIGLEPLEKTREVLLEIIERGAVPILTYFPPYPESPLAREWKVKPQDTVGLYTLLFEKLIQKKISPNWVQQHDVVLTPLEGRFFSKESPRHYLAIRNLLKTGWGRGLRLGMAAMRRRLRVRGVHGAAGSLTQGPPAT